MSGYSMQVQSEIGKLEKVIVHAPDIGISRISPKDSDELLFDDIVYLPNMKIEHRIFVDVLKLFLGDENVYEVEDLLRESLDYDSDIKGTIIEWIVDFEELPTKYIPKFKSMSSDVLAKLFITGYYPPEDHIFFDPIPNFIFTRDIAAMINDHVLITKAAKSARHRENFLTRCIFWAHPLFKPIKHKGRVINLNHVDSFPPSKKGEPICLEGGDVMIINRKNLLIGQSERTNAHTIRSLANVLFEKRIVENVVQVTIPADRSFMHIDTIFTQINYNHIVAYKPIVIDGYSSYVNVLRANGQEEHYPSIADYFLNEINPNMQFILGGMGESPYQEREQWTDGCNLVALKPGVALAYDRNPRTELALKEHGYEIMTARNLITQVNQGDLDVAQIENTIITLPSNELARARGGSHCMTCPIERVNL